MNKRRYAYVLLAQFMRNKLSFEKLCKKFPITSVEFWVDYSLDDPDMNLGALAPFIIDVDMDSTVAIIRVEYGIKISEESLKSMFESCFIENDNLVYNKIEDIRDVCIANFSKIFVIMSLGILLSTLAGAAIGTWSKTQMMATSITVPVMLVLSFLPMFSQFNSSIAKLSKFVYSEQISHMLRSVNNMQIEVENISIIVVNMLIVTGVFVVAYHKSRLD